MSLIVDFLARLAIDERLFAQFLTDPAAALETAGVYQDETTVTTIESTLLNLLLQSTPQSGSAQQWADWQPHPSPRGTLTVIGTGIRTIGQLTLEAIACMRHSDVVLYLTADPIAEMVVRHLNPNGATSLFGYYQEGMPRTFTYEAMVQHILSCVRDGKKTCAAFYGHPGVFAYPSHEAIRRARQEGYSATMLPAVSAEDCLFADLGVDPAVNGCQSFEATDFLMNDRIVDTSSQLILWQVGVVGDWTYRANGYDLRVFPLLVSRLRALYGGSHTTYIYEAATLPKQYPRIIPIALDGLSPDLVTPASTLYVPPVRNTTVNSSIVKALEVARDLR